MYYLESFWLYNVLLALKTLNKIIADDILIIIIILKKNKTRHIMWIVCLADDSHGMSILILFSLQNKNQLSSAAVVISILRVKSDSLQKVHMMIQKPPWVIKSQVPVMKSFLNG